MNAHQRRKQSRQAARRPSMLAHLTQVLEAHQAATRRENEERERAERAKRIQQRVTQLQLVTAMINALGGDPEQIKLVEGEHETVITYCEQDVTLSFVGFTEAFKVMGSTNGYIVDDLKSLIFVHIKGGYSMQFHLKLPVFIKGANVYTVDDGFVKSFALNIAEYIRAARDKGQLANEELPF